MNEFEIKTAKEMLKSVGLLNIYKISQEYNMQEYETMAFDVVIEFEHKNSTFLTYCSQRTYELSKENKVQTAKMEIEKLKKEIDKKILQKSKTDIDTSSIQDFIGLQMECWYVKEEVSITHEEFDKLTEAIEKKINKLEVSEKYNAYEIYEKVIKYWKELDEINE